MISKYIFWFLLQWYHLQLQKVGYGVCSGIVAAVGSLEWEAIVVVQRGSGLAKENI